MINEDINIMFQTRMPCISSLIEHLGQKSFGADRREWRQEPVQIEIKMFREVQELELIHLKRLINQFLLYLTGAG